MIPFTWQVESINESTGTMIVKYSPDAAPNLAVSLNVPMVPLGDDVAAHVTKFAPSNEWSRIVNGGFESVRVGLGGSATATVAQSSETPVTSGSWNEEYLRALIYQVMEEMKESAA